MDSRKLVTAKQLIRLLVREFEKREMSRMYSEYTCFLFVLN